VLRAFQPLCWTAGFSTERFLKLLRIGAPVGLQHLMEVGAFVFAALMMGWVSADAIAAHQIAITCAATTFMFPLGIGMASTIRVGHAWGAGQHARLRRIGFVGICLAAVVMGVFALMFVLAGAPLARLFVTSPVVIALAAQLLLVAAVFQIADGVQIAAICALRGVSDVRIPAIVAIVAYWVLAVPMAYGLGVQAKQGAVGIWIGLAAGLAAAAIGLSWRFHRRTQKSVAMRR
jgi:multidrug resistance protein, MATE family